MPTNDHTEWRKFLQPVVTGLVALMAAGVGYLQYLQRADGEKRDSRIAVLEQKVAEHDKMMENGNERFDRIERELKETNGLLRELVGMFKMSTRAKSHTPEDGPC